MKVIIALLMALPFFVSCSKDAGLEESLWTEHGSESAPVIARADEFKTQETAFMIHGDLIQRSSQKWGPVYVEGTSLTKIADKNNKLKFQRAKFADFDWRKNEKYFLQLDLNKYVFLENFKKMNSDVRQATRVFAPKVVVSKKFGYDHPFYQIDYVDSLQTGVYRLKVDMNGTLLEHQTVSAFFESGHGIVFPGGPKISALSDVSFTEMLGDGTLSKNSHHVTTQSSTPVQSTDEFFKFDPTDVRFDQVQAFYFVDQAVQFFQNQIGTTIPFSIEVQTQVGFPDKTNAMFYYDGTIYLGSGDGVTYAKIMQDPSIVTHEACHALIQVLANLPSGQGEGGSMNEAFADYFATAFLDDPNLGEVAFVKGPYSRSVDNTMHVSDKNGSLYHDSLIVSGTFYEIQKKIGKKPALDLAVKALVRMGASGVFANFKQSVDLALQQGFSADQKSAVEAILQSRGWAQ